MNGVKILKIHNVRALPADITSKSREFVAVPAYSAAVSVPVYSAAVSVPAYSTAVPVPAYSTAVSVPAYSTANTQLFHMD